LKYRPPPVPNRVGQSPPAPTRGMASSSRSRFSSSLCLRGLPGLPSATLVLCGVPRRGARTGQPPFDGISATGGRLAPRTGRRRRAGGLESERPNCRARARRGDGQRARAGDLTDRRPAAWQRTGRAEYAARSALLQLLMELVTGKQQQVLYAPVVESQINELVGVDIWRHIRFQSSKGNTY